jgi:hypothetical protein
MTRPGASESKKRCHDLPIELVKEGFLVKIVSVFRKILKR